MANLSNINSITIKGKRLEFVENNDNWKTSTNDKKKTILSRYVIEQMLNSQSVSSTQNNFLSLSESWNLETENGNLLSSNPIYKFIELKFINDTVETTIFKDVITKTDNLNTFSRTSEQIQQNIAIVKILNGYDYKYICIPKNIKLVDKIDSTKNKIYDVKVVIIEPTQHSLDTIIAPTVEYFTNKDNFVNIGEEISIPTNSNLSTNITEQTMNIVSKSFIWFNSISIDFNLILDVEDIVDLSCINNESILKLTLNSCVNLLPVGIGFKEIILSSNIKYLKDYTGINLFLTNKTCITIPDNFECDDNILDKNNISKQDFERLTILDIDYISRVQNPKLEKPINRYTLLNQEDRQMELFYRHRMNVSNDALFKRNNELYDQTYKLELIPNSETNTTKYFYKSDVDSNYPIYFFASMIYDEDYNPYELSEYKFNESEDSTEYNTITITGDKLFKVEVSEKFNNLKFRFKNNSTNNDQNYIIRYSMPNLNSSILDSKGVGTLFLNDGTSFIEAGMDDKDADKGNWGLMPSSPNRIEKQCLTICKTIYFGVEFFNSEIIDNTTTKFRYGKYIHPTLSSESDEIGCFDEIYIPFECIEIDPEKPTKTEEERIKIVKRILFGSETFGGEKITVHFYKDSNIATDFTTKKLKVRKQRNVFGRKYYVINA